MKTTGWIGAWLLATTMTAANAATLSVHVTDDHGKAVANAVVMVTPMDAANRPAQPAATTKFVDQKDLMFLPYLEMFRPGDKVVFRNSDKTRHHVYSFAPTKTFQFILVPGQTSPALTLDRTGVIAVGCNIHDQMIAYLYVSDAPWIARSGTDGQAVFRDLPDGGYTIGAWQPRLRNKSRVPEQSIALAGATETKTLAFKLSLLPDSRRNADREHTSY